MPAPSAPTTAREEPQPTLITPEGLELTDRVFAVAADGTLLLLRGKQVCGYSRDGDESFCTEPAGFDPFGDPRPRFVAWSPDGRQLAFESGEGLSQIVAVDVNSGAARSAGGIAQEVAAASPFWVDGELHWISYRLGTPGGALTSERSVVVDSFVPPRNNAATRPQFVTVAGEVVSLSVQFEPDGILVSRHPSWPDPIGEPQRVLPGRPLSFATSPTGASLLIGPLLDDGVSWWLMTASDLVPLPFDGAAAAASPDGMRAAGVRAAEPEVLVVVDNRTMTEETSVPVAGPIDHVFWSSAGTITVLSRGDVYEIGV